MPSRRLLLLSALPAALLGTSAHAWSFGKDMRGSGHEATQQRQHRNIQALAVRASVQVVVRQSGREAVEVRGDDNLLDMIETRELGDGTLEIGMKSGISITGASPLVVTVDVIGLRALSLSGSSTLSMDALTTEQLSVHLSGSTTLRLRHVQAQSLSLETSGSSQLTLGGPAKRVEAQTGGSSRVHLDGLNAETLRVTMGGSSQLRAGGQAQELTLSLGGSAILRAEGLSAERAKIGLGGSSMARLQAQQSLDASASGSSSLVYEGNPKSVNRSTSGAATIRPS